jgi:hypothetical protein
MTPICDFQCGEWFFFFPSRILFMFVLILESLILKFYPPPPQFVYFVVVFYIVTEFWRGTVRPRRTRFWKYCSDQIRVCEERDFLVLQFTTLSLSRLSMASKFRIIDE